MTSTQSHAPRTTIRFGALHNECVADGSYYDLAAPMGYVGGRSAHSAHVREKCLSRIAQTICSLHGIKAQPVGNQRFSPTTTTGRKCATKDQHPGLRKIYYGTAPGRAPSSSEEQFDGDTAIRQAPKQQPKRRIHKPRLRQKNAQG